MKVLEQRDAFLSDYEVLQFLSKLERKHKWDDENLAKQQQNRGKRVRGARPYFNPPLQRAVRDTISYLQVNKNYVPQEDEDEAAKNARMSAPITRMNDEQFIEFYQGLDKYELFKLEKLQIMNQLPRNMVHLYAIVEECDSRFTEAQIQDIISIVERYA